MPFLWFPYSVLNTAFTNYQSWCHSDSNTRLGDILYFYFCIYFFFSTECPIGLYGYFCDEMCGHCIDPTQCSSESGICLTGCSAGYVGPSCKEGICLFRYAYSLARDKLLYICSSVKIIRVYFGCFWLKRKFTAYNTLYKTCKMFTLKKKMLQIIK